jgi:excisionase family DNA binding protein
MVLAQLEERGTAAAGDGWLDVAGAAAYMACKPQRVYDLVSAGRLRVAKDGARSVFRREWLDAYLLGGEAA